MLLEFLCDNGTVCHISCQGDIGDALFLITDGLVKCTDIGTGGSQRATRDIILEPGKVLYVCVCLCVGVCVRVHVRVRVLVRVVCVCLYVCVRDKLVHVQAGAHAFKHAQMLTCALQVFGERALLLDEARAATVVALSPSVTCLTLDRHSVSVIVCT